MPENLASVNSASLSKCRRYRYELRREWDANGKSCVFIGLNPSSADESRDDPTIRRCIKFAKTWGYGCLEMVNLFAYRSTDPAFQLHVHDPVGKANDKSLVRVCNSADLVVAAWE